MTGTRGNKREAHWAAKEGVPSKERKSRNEAEWPRTLRKIFSNPCVSDIHHRLTTVFGSKQGQHGLFTCATNGGHSRGSGGGDNRDVCGMQPSIQPSGPKGP